MPDVDDDEVCPFCLQIGEIETAIHPSDDEDMDYHGAAHAMGVLFALVSTLAAKRLGPHVALSLADAFAEGCASVLSTEAGTQPNGRSTMTH